MFSFFRFFVLVFVVTCANLAYCLKTDPETPFTPLRRIRLQPPRPIHPANRSHGAISRGLTETTAGILRFWTANISPASFCSTLIIAIRTSIPLTIRTSVRPPLRATTRRKSHSPESAAISITTTSAGACSLNSARAQKSFHAMTEYVSRPIRSFRCLSVFQRGIRRLSFRCMARHQRGRRFVYVLYRLIFLLQCRELDVSAVVYIR